MKKVEKCSFAGTEAEQSTNVDVSSVSQPNAKPNVSSSFVCGGCGHTLDLSFSLRTKGYCYLCDPNITLEELLSEEEIN
jgi:hypothetical protein